MLCHILHAIYESVTDKRKLWCKYISHRDVKFETLFYVLKHSKIPVQRVQQATDLLF
jgi:hypothetical protein